MVVIALKVGPLDLTLVLPPLKTVVNLESTDPIVFDPESTTDVLAGNSGTATGGRSVTPVEAEVAVSGEGSVAATGAAVVNNAADDPEGSETGDPEGSAAAGEIGSVDASVVLEIAGSTASRRFLRRPITALAVLRRLSGSKGGFGPLSIAGPGGTIVGGGFVVGGGNVVGGTSWDKMSRPVGISSSSSFGSGSLAIGGRFTGSAFATATGGLLLLVIGTGVTTSATKNNSKYMFHIATKFKNQVNLLDR